jgi:hypothetical protein
MRLFLQTESKDYEKVDFIVETIIPVKDVEILFFQKDQICGLENGKDSKPYDEYEIRKVQSILIGHIEDDTRIDLSIAAYLSEDGLSYHIINQTSENGDQKYLCSMDDNLIDHKAILINYTEYKEFMEKTFSKNILTYMIYIQAIVTKNESLYRRYNLYKLGDRKNEEGFHELSSNSALNIFFEEH